MQGEAPVAREHFDQAITILDAAVGSDHPDTMHARSGLAVVLQDLGEVDAAYALQHEVVAGMTTALGPTYLDVGA